MYLMEKELKKMIELSKKMERMMKTKGMKYAFNLKEFTLDVNDKLQTNFYALTLICLTE